MQPRLGRALELALQQRFTILTVTLVTYLFALAPMVDRSPLWDDITRAVLSAVVLSSIYACVRRGKALLALSVAAVPVVILIWLTRASPDNANLSIANHLATASVLLLTTVFLVTDVISTPRVTSDTVFGAVSAYLLIGLVFGLVYAAEYAFDPRAFDLPAHVVERVGGGSVGVELRTFTYFSFVTLSTLGYGDVVPANGAAQATAAGQAVIGQVFLAVTVARLVALQITHQREG